MDLVAPGLGLLFWNTLTFLTVLLILWKTAWKPITAALKEREDGITTSLHLAEKAKSDMKLLQSENEKMLQEARLERDKMMKEAKVIADKIVADAKGKALEESNKIVASAQEAIQNEKMAALTEVKNQMANLSVSIAEKLLRNELSNKGAQTKLIEGYMADIKMN